PFLTLYSFPTRRSSDLDFNLTGFRIETSNEIRLLGCKPNIPLWVNRRRMRITDAGIGHVIFGDLSGLGIELSNVSLEDRSEPDIDRKSTRLNSSHLGIS